MSLSTSAGAMNVFVLSTGRCGSTTFTRACGHITNFSATHESRFGSLRERLNYPDDHIEADNRLTWFLGRLDRQYGDKAFYVHLKRDREATAKSYAQRHESGIIRAYKERMIYKADDDPTVSPLDVCRHYCDTVNANIDLFLKDKGRSMEFRLESAEDNFREFWNRIGAEGDLSAALQEWGQKYNASDLEEDPEAEPSPLPIRVAKKAVRVMQKFPRFVRTA